MFLLFNSEDGSSEDTNNTGFDFQGYLIYLTALCTMYLMILSTANLVKVR